MHSTKNFEWHDDEFLGSGTFGLVYKGKKKCDNSTVAVKKFIGTPPTYMKKEADAVKLASEQSHPNIVKFFGFEQGILALEYCSGGSLENHINSNGLPPNEFKAFFSQFITGLEHLRELRLLHRDLKPENILVEGIGENQIYKISDFGAARVLKKNARYGSLYGTAEYLHPDVFAHFYFSDRDIVLPKREFVAEHEIWQMAVTIYHAATGYLPFEPKEGTRENPKLMYQMLTEKKSKHISATETKNGLIFHSHLPSSCKLDKSIKRKLAALFAGMLKPKKMWTFEKVFHESKKIFQNGNDHRKRKELKRLEPNQYRDRTRGRTRGRILCRNVISRSGLRRQCRKK